MPFNGEHAGRRRATPVHGLQRPVSKMPEQNVSTLFPLGEHGMGMGECGSVMWWAENVGYSFDEKRGSSSPAVPCLQRKPLQGPPEESAAALVAPEESAKEQHSGLCWYCGMLVFDDSKFCGVCGRPVLQRRPAVSSTTATSLQTPRTTSGQTMVVMSTQASPISIPDTCPTGHPLFEFLTEDNDQFCFVCKTDQPSCSKLWGCGLCGFTVCIKCLRCQWRSACVV